MIHHSVKNAVRYIERLLCSICSSCGFEKVMEAKSGNSPVFQCAKV